METLKREGSEKERAVSDMLKAVADEQAALARLVSLQGEKLQEIFQEENLTNKQALAFHKSVVTLMKTILKIDEILQSKIKLLLG